MAAHDEENVGMALNKLVEQSLPAHAVCLIMRMGIFALSAVFCFVRDVTMGFDNDVIIRELGIIQNGICPGNDVFARIELKAENHKMEIPYRKRRIGVRSILVPAKPFHVRECSPLEIVFHLFIGKLL